MFQRPTEIRNYLFGSLFAFCGGSGPGLLRPHPDPVQEHDKVLPHGAVVGEPQPSLSRLTGHLDGVAKIIGPLGAPVH